MSLFSLKTARKAGKVVGYCAYLANSRLYKTSLTNLQLCFPELNAKEIQDLARLSLINTGMALAESGPVWLWPVDRVLGAIEEVEGAALLQKARDLGKGVILLGPHHGNWELMGLYLSSLGNCSQLYQTPRNAELDTLLHVARSRASAKMFPADARGVAAVLGALKKGEMTGILPDQVPAPGAGEFTPFFGNDAYTMTLVSRLLQKTGAIALLAYAKRTETGFRIIIKQPDTDIYAKHMAKSLAGLNRTVELAVKDAPEQYQWEYKRFRYQPEGKLEPYRA